MDLMIIVYQNNEWFPEKNSTASSLAFCAQPDYLF